MNNENVTIHLSKRLCHALAQLARHAGVVGDAGANDAIGDMFEAALNKGDLQLDDTLLPDDDSDQNRFKDRTMIIQFEKEMERLVLASR